MHRTTRSAAPLATASGDQPTPQRTPAKRGRKPKLTPPSATSDLTKEESELTGKTAPLQQEVDDSPKTPHSSQEEEDRELSDPAIVLDGDDLPVFMSTEEGHMILDVLEKIDADGLLDQPVNVAAVFFSQSSSDQHEVSSTLRSLLDQSNDVSLRHIFKAAQNFAKRVAPKTRRKSAVSERTIKFCQLLHQLLLELIRSKGGVSGQRINLEVVQDDTRHGTPSSPYYALFQQLGAAGTYFSSAAKMSKEQLTNLSIGQAETVAVVPTQVLPPSSLPTLSSLVLQRAVKTRHAEPLTIVARLPYEPFASFAPTHATDAAQTGTYESVLAHHAAASFRKWEKLNWPNARRSREIKPYSRARRIRSGRMDKESVKGQKRPRDSEEDEWDRAKRRKLEDGTVHQGEEQLSHSSDSTADTATLDMDTRNACIPSPDETIDPALWDEGLLQEVNSVIGEGSGLLDLDTLLDENTKALHALRGLQDSRFRAGSQLAQDSVEFKLAKALHNNLSMLIDWQPRTGGLPQEPALVPDVLALAKVRRSLPLEPVSGFKGILKPTSTALKDNTTVRTNANTMAPATANPVGAAAAYSASIGGQQNHISRQSAYPSTPYSTTQASISYQSAYGGTQAYASPNGVAQPYSHYTGAYGGNGQTYAAGYAGYGSPGQGYTAYPAYSYGIGATGYGVAAYASSQQSSGRSTVQPMANAQTWSYPSQTPATALPPHMRPVATRSAMYGVSNGHSFTTWSRQ